jgi:hypothetical protein
MNHCKNCHKSPNDCPCETPIWVDEDGEQLDYKESINESVNRIARNTRRPNNDDIPDFPYVAGDPFW